MWDYLHSRRAFDLSSQPFDMINSPFAFPRLPSMANPPLGLSNVGRIKDSIVNDKNAMMSRLFDYQEMFQQYASGLFNLSPSRIVPGHPMNKVHKMNTLQEENERLRKENSSFKTTLVKEKKK